VFCFKSSFVDHLSNLPPLEKRKTQEGFYSLIIPIIPVIEIKCMSNSEEKPWTISNKLESKALLTSNKASTFS
jgi:hypothetical protein